ncbi:hypothetical protein VCHC55A1_0323, partial [Vibrio cholerae HC-55A1]
MPNSRFISQLGRKVLSSLACGQKCDTIRSFLRWGQAPDRHGKIPPRFRL